MRFVVMGVDANAQLPPRCENITGPRAARPECEVPRLRRAQARAVIAWATAWRLSAVNTFAPPDWAA
eukprot:877237-Lingulodinium_polyedra.AAC.1